MTNKYTQDMTGTGRHIVLPEQLELFPELCDDPEPERYYDWMLWKMRQEKKNNSDNNS